MHRLLSYGNELSMKVRPPFPPPLFGLGDAPRYHLYKRRGAEEDRGQDGQEEAEASAEKSPPGKETSEAVLAPSPAQREEKYKRYCAGQFQPEADIHPSVLSFSSLIIRALLDLCRVRMERSRPPPRLPTLCPPRPALLPQPRE